jgi:hypothetical protein
MASVGWQADGRIDFNDSNTKNKDFGDFMVDWESWNKRKMKTDENRK